jgi:hypothetical protein
VRQSALETARGGVRGSAGDGAQRKKGQKNKRNPDGEGYWTAPLEPDQVFLMPSSDPLPYVISLFLISLSNSPLGFDFRGAQPHHHLPRRARASAHAPAPPRYPSRAPHFAHARTPKNPVRRHRQLARIRTCFTCHSVEGSAMHARTIREKEIVRLHRALAL